MLEFIDPFLAFVLLLGVVAFALFSDAKSHHGVQASIVALVTGLALGALFGVAFTYSPMFEPHDAFTEISNDGWSEYRIFLRVRGTIMFAGAFAGMIASYLSLRWFGARRKPTAPSASRAP